MDARRYAERAANDEGLMGELGDAEAAALLAWLRKELTRRLKPLKARVDREAAEAAYRDVTGRARRLAALVSAWCSGQDQGAAARELADLGYESRPADLPRDAAAATRQLIEWEKARGA